MSDGREVHRAAEVVVIIGSLHDYLLPFSSSRLFLDKYKKVAYIIDHTHTICFCEKPLWASVKASLSHLSTKWARAFVQHVSKQKKLMGCNIGLPF